MEAVPVTSRRRCGFTKYFRGSLRSIIDRDCRALQFSYVGRALPEASPGQCDAALTKYREELSQPATTPDSILDSAEEWARRWASRFLSGPVVPPTWLSGGACKEVPRAKGGLGTRSVDVARRATDAICEPSEPEWESLRERLNAVEGLTDCDVDIVCRERLVSNQALVELSELPRPIAVDAMALPERGGKVRIVTKCPWALVYLGHFLRVWLLEGLRRDERTKSVLDGDHAGSVGGLVGGAGVRLLEHLAVSADLTAASDLLPHDLCQAIVRGVLRGSRTRPAPHLDEVWADLIGPLTIQMPDGSEFVNQRGIMMGLPTTWTILSLVHLYWAEWAWASTVPRHISLSGLPSAAPRTAICGDDLAAVWPTSVVQRYESIVKSCGGQFSAGKHYKSRTYLMFTEEAFRLRVEMRDYDTRRVDGRRPGEATLADFLPSWMVEEPSRDSRWCTGVDHLPLVPLRGLVRPLHLPKDRQPLPVWVAVPHCVEAACTQSGDAGAVRRILRVLHPGIHRWARSRGFAVNAPTSLGGYGLPPVRGDPKRARLPKWFRWGISSLLRATPWKDLINPARAWAPVMRDIPHRDMGADHASEKLKVGAVAARKGRVPFMGRGADLGYDAEDRLTVRLSNELLFILDRDTLPSSFFLQGPRKVSGAVRKMFKQHLRRFPIPEGSVVASETPMASLRRRWEEVRTARSWWSSPRGAAEGFVLGISSSAKRAVASALGWASMEPAHSGGPVSD
ncbi:RNA-dependent RNA polymerase [Beihai narna-like virus 24]|uniref:RNA-dependent RNA polymerase n=1 Tax=Beihai narna-like virus 24 TaxID=1922452 RepID=UPI00090995CE|nr:RNA-dependent RNA polymerase [Beihai narna-like virus 24]APG77072.1 RNA-dependent RNA polymerase [Beihai narna-like virus 24]